MSEKTLATRTVFTGRLLNVEELSVELPDGRRSTREVVRHPGAAVVLAQIPDGRFIFERQFRKPLERWVVEVVAGTLEPGEDPAVCARRELREETGHEALSLVGVGEIFSAPGYTDECLHVFLAQASGETVARELDEDEYLEVLYLTEDEVEGLVARGEIGDAKTLAAWLLRGRGRVAK